MSNSLFEAFQALEILNEDTFDMTSDGVAKLKEFEDGDTIDEIETIIDPLAETEEDLQQSYLGKAILNCIICQSKIYKDPSEIILSEDESLVNVGEECPYCQSPDGYKVIGQVAEYNPSKDDSVESDDVEKVEIDDEEIELDESKKLEEAKSSKPKKVKNYKTIDALWGDVYDDLGRVLRKASIVSDVYSVDDDSNDMHIELDKDVDTTPLEDVVKKYNLKSSVKNKGKYKDFRVILPKDISEYKKPDGKLNERIVSRKGVRKLKSVKEDFNKVDIETEKSKMTMTSDENGKVTVTTEPIEKMSDMETIEPLSTEMEAEIKSQEPEYQDIEIDEFDEEEFDNLGESYLKRVYENVASYKTTKGSVNGNTLKLEGLIKFKSGKEVKTNFKFESKTITKSGKLKLIGENQQFAKGKKSFTLTGKVDGKKLIIEGLTYNYRAKDMGTGKSKRLYGTVSR